MNNINQVIEFIKEIEGLKSVTRTVGSELHLRPTPQLTTMQDP